MSRKKGTTGKSVRSRRARNDKTARLILLARRFGVACGVLVFTLWLGAWFFLSGAAERSVVWTQHKIYDMAAGAGFYVDEILVEGRIHADADVIRAIVNLDKGDPIFAFDPARTKQMIEKISWVRDAHIERRLPRTIYVGLLEREPVALWQHQQRIRVIDPDGVVLTDKGLERFADLIILTGAEAPQHARALFALLTAEPDILPHVEAAAMVGARRWDLRMKNGVTVKLPAQDAGLALRYLARAQESDDILNKDLEMIDMRVPERITVRTRPGAVSEYKASFVNDI